MAVSCATILPMGISDSRTQARAGIGLARVAPVLDFGCFIRNDPATESTLKFFPQ